MFSLLLIFTFRKLSNLPALLLRVPLSSLEEDDLIAIVELNLF